MQSFCEGLFWADALIIGRAVLRPSVPATLKDAIDGHGTGSTFSHRKEGFPCYGNVGRFVTQGVSLFEGHEHVRQYLVAHLEAKRIETLISWPIPLHRHEALNLAHFSLPETEAISREVVSLPMCPELTGDELDIVANSVRGFFAAHRARMG